MASSSDRKYEFFREFSIPESPQANVQHLACFIKKEFIAFFFTCHNLPSLTLDIIWNKNTVISDTVYIDFSINISCTCCNELHHVYSGFVYVKDNLEYWFHTTLLRHHEIKDLHVDNEFFWQKQNRNLSAAMRRAKRSHTRFERLTSHW